jgi:cell division protein FtsB
MKPAQVFWRHWPKALGALAIVTTVVLLVTVALSIISATQLSDTVAANRLLGQQLQQQVKASRALAARVAVVQHDVVQQNIDARYSDCQGSEKVRAALRDQVRRSAKTDPLLFRLLPSLDTAEVRRLVRVERARQLKAYAPRSCRSYAIASVPAGQRSQYTVPVS